MLGNVDNDFRLATILILPGDGWGLINKYCPKNKIRIEIEF